MAANGKDNVGGGDATPGSSEGGAGGGVGAVSTATTPEGGTATK